MLATRVAMCLLMAVSVCHRDVDFDETDDDYYYDYGDDDMTASTMPLCSVSARSTSCDDEPNSSGVAKHIIKKKINILIIFIDKKNYDKNHFTKHFKNIKMK